MAFQGLMKIFLVVLNLIFFIVGAATFAVGIWVKVDKKHLLELTKDVSGADLEDTDIPSLLENAVVVLIVAGSFIFLLGFLGCFGTTQNKNKFGKLSLKIYATVVLILLILEIAAVAIAVLFFDKVEIKLKEYLDASLENRYNGSFRSSGKNIFIYSSGGDAITLAWDNVQLQHGCCGRANGSDYSKPDIYWSTKGYRDIEFDNGTVVKLVVPPTCCAVSGGSKDLIADLKKVSAAEFSLEEELCPYQSVDPNIPGCYDKLKEVIVDNIFLFVGIGGSTLLIELLCITFACCLAKRNNDEVSSIKDE